MHLKQPERQKAGGDKGINIFHPIPLISIFIGVSVLGYIAGGASAIALTIITNVKKK